MIRNATEKDFPRILELNEASVSFLSPMDNARLQQLHGQACYHRVVEKQGQVVAFLLAFREAADYDSINYRWFAGRYPRFLYIDRIVVDSAYRSEGLGKKLYENSIEFARQKNIPMLTCEYDVMPPNPISARFHQQFGFTEAGEQIVGGGSKKVSLQILSLD